MLRTRQTAYLAMERLLVVIIQERDLERILQLGVLVLWKRVQLICVLAAIRNIFPVAGSLDDYPIDTISPGVAACQSQLRQCKATMFGTLVTAWQIQLLFRLMA